MFQFRVFSYRVPEKPFQVQGYKLQGKNARIQLVFTTFKPCNLKLVTCNYRQAENQ